MTSSGWAASFASGLHAALVRRIPPQRNCPELEQLSLALMEALEQGNLTVPLSAEREQLVRCLLYTSPSPRDKRQSRMPSSA